MERDSGPGASEESKQGALPRALCLVETAGLPGGETLCRVLSSVSRCETRTFESLAGLRRSLQPGVPALIVIPEPDQAGDDLAACVEWLKAAGPPAALILVINRSLWPKTQELLRSAPRTQLLFGNHRLTARLVEAVLSTLGVRPRVHPRSAARIAGRLQGDDGAIEPFELVDLSESGARIRLKRKLDIGLPVLLRFTLEDRPFEVEALPMRVVVSTPDTFEMGLQFEQPNERLIDTIRGMVQASKRAQWPFSDPLRVQPRVRLTENTRVRVRLQPEGQARQTYLTATDISRTGLYAIGPANVALGVRPGDKCDLLVSWRGRGFRCRALVARLEKERGAEALGIQFEGLANEARQTLSELLARMGE